MTPPTWTTDPPSQRAARLTGVLFILTFITSIAALGLYGPVLDGADFIRGEGSAAQARAGALLEVLLVIANVGTAVVLFPVLRRVHETLALGYVASRIVESTAIAVGIVSLLSVVTLRTDVSGAGVPSLVPAAESLVALHDATFLLGPGFCVGVGNGLMLGYLMYRSGLVPRRMAVLGLVGGPLILVSATLALFGVHEQLSATGFLLSVPEIAWEGSLGVYLAVKGFRVPSAAAAGADRPVGTAPGYATAAA